MNLTDLFLLLNAFCLGLRHGVDWDHIAAIFDIVAGTNRKEKAKTFFRDEPVSLSFAYAIGHGLVVVFLGMVAICFCSHLPAWIDPIMERVVGITLLLLGGWVTFCLLRTIFVQQQPVMSRGALILSLFDKATIWLKLQKESSLESRQQRAYDFPAALAVGAIHGIGAQTGTQILVLMAVGTVSKTAAVVVLCSFVLGIACSNIIVAIISSLGIMPAKALQPAYVVSTLLVAGFSLYVGCVFCLGQANALPDLPRLLGA